MWEKSFTDSAFLHKRISKRSQLVHQAKYAGKGQELIDIVTLSVVCIWEKRAKGAN